MVEVDGRNVGKNDSTPTPVVLAIFDDVPDENKAALVGLFQPETKQLETRTRALMFDEQKLATLRQSKRLDSHQLQDEDGKTKCDI